MPHWIAWMETSMILEADADKLTITSEDPVEAEYLKSFFGDLVRVRKESNFVRNGFHKTNKRSVCVTLTKQEGGEEDT